MPEAGEAAAQGPRLAAGENGSGQRQPDYEPDTKQSLSILRIRRCPIIYHLTRPMKSEVESESQKH